MNQCKFENLTLLYQRAITFVHILLCEVLEWGSQLPHCPSCGKENDKPSTELKSYFFTIQDYNCRKCHHNFRVTVNQSLLR